jgi:excisionase family DNA binding protein
MGRKRPFDRVGDRLLTVGEVAATMRVSNMTVYRLIKSGQLAAVRVGKNYRIRESDVNQYLSVRSVQVEGNE